MEVLKVMERERPIRRPFCWAGYSFLAGTFAASFLSLTADLAAAATALFFSVIFRFVWKERRAFLVSLSAAAAFAWISGYLFLFYEPVRSLAGQELSFTGVVEEIESSSGRTRFTVGTRSLDGQGAPQQIRVRISGYGDYDVERGDLIAGKILFLGEEDDGSAENDTFAETAEERASGIRSYASFVEQPTVLQENFVTGSTLLAAYRGWFTDSLGTYLSGDSFRLLEKMIFGVGDDLDTEITDHFRRAGMSAILCVSGMHMVAVAWFAEKLLGTVCTGRKKRAVLLIAVTVLYAAAAGFGMSVLRAAFMMLVRYVGMLTDSEPDAPSSLAFGASLVVLIDPAAACDCGFLMSVAGSLGIVTCSVPLSLLLWKAIPRRLSLTKRGRRRMNLLLENIGICVSAWSFTAPICAAFYGIVCFAGLVSNLFAGPVAMLAIYAGIPTAVLSQIPVLKAVGFLTAKLAEFFAVLLIGMAKAFSAVPESIVPAESGWLFLWIAGTILLFVMPRLMHTRLRFYKLAVLLSLTALCIGLTGESVLKKGLTEIRVVPLEEGTAVSCTANGQTLLIAENLGYDDTYSVRKIAGYYNNHVAALVSAGDGDAAAELRLEEIYAPELSVLSDPAAVSRAGAEAAFYPMEVMLGDGTRAVFFSGQDFAVETEDTVLLYYSGGCDIMDIEAKYRRPDIAVVRGVSMEKISVLRCGSLVTIGCGGVFGGADEIVSAGSGGVTFYCRGETVKRG
ncbi:MAG TPA: ComEC/Rec2 family competence protein [Oscillospiraceae bacterium]|nr:ComEC/Rec2 family competence protein [Oscillospiraceae bacterium]